MEELGALLVTLRAQVYLARQRLDRHQGEEARRALGLAEQHLRAMGRLVEDLRASGGAGAGWEPDLRPRAVDLGAELLDEVAAHAAAFQAAAIPLEADVAPGTWARADPDRAREGLRALLQHALAGPVKGPVRVEVRPERGEVVVRVAGGPGAPRARLARAFEPFERLPGGGRPGLRLYRCRRLAERQGGRAWADEVQGRLVLAFALPAAPPARPEP